MIIYKRKGLVFGEVYFEYEPRTTPKVDILRIVSLPKPLANIKTQAKQTQTLMKDLCHDEQALFDEMNEGTRYEVRRAMSKDNLLYKYDDKCSEHEVQVFCDYYDEFATVKKLRPIFRQRLKILAHDKMLILTSALANDNKVLVSHAYILNGSRAALLYSASLFRLTDDSSMRYLIGRANRFLHWNDIITFKRNGCLFYDMGGIDVKSKETTTITAFKRGFGGSVADNYHYTIPKSMLGYVACKIFDILGVEI